MVRTDTNVKKENHQEAEVTQGLGLGKGVIVVEAESGRSQDPGVGIGRSQDPEAERGRNHDPEAGKENVGSDLVPAQDQDIGIGVEAGVGQGVEVGRNWKQPKCHLKKECLCEFMGKLVLHSLNYVTIILTQKSITWLY
uniref:Uncharacterized protein n=1 Tax=Moschus moschiferus TaxID=68415 RepID=A0A8C6CYE8_MOSMO